MPTVVWAITSLPNVPTNFEKSWEERARSAAFFQHDGTVRAVRMQHGRSRSTAYGKDTPEEPVDLGRRQLILEPHDSHPVGLVVLQHFLVPARQVNKDKETWSKQPGTYDTQTRSNAG